MDEYETHVDALERMRENREIWQERDLDFPEAKACQFFIARDIIAGNYK